MLGQRSERAHGTEILAHLESQDAAALSAQPTVTLQSSLQRPKEQGEIESTGSNRWRPRTAPSEPAAPSLPAYEPSPPVVTSTTTFGGRPTSAQ
ncbi:MAG: hypothetical protein F4X58_13375 [Chloroflexi bacterium]|nr:hypothetical protein [Chloroflexota bacterium]MYC02897.1 hypothetical protein [Chloroflexota bacterium]